MQKQKTKTVLAKNQSFFCAFLKFIHVLIFLFLKNSVFTNQTCHKWAALVGQ